MAMSNLAVKGDIKRQPGRDAAFFNRLGREHLPEYLGVQVTEVEDGVLRASLVLKKAHGSGETSALDITRDDTAIQNKAQGFVTAFNALARLFGTLGGYSAAAKSGGPLQGDAMLLGISSQVRRIISDPVAGATGDYRTLASLGITTTADGTLQLDAAKFQKALAADPQAVGRIFGGEGGVALRLGSYVDARLATGGEIATRSASLTSSQQALEKQRDALDARMQLVQERYLRQFTALDSLLSQLQNTSSYLSQQLAGLSKLANYSTSNN